jgi:hypothetical protein
MVASVMKKTLAQDFPHLKLPAAVFATIDSAAKSDAFDIEELIVHNEVTGEVFKAHITSYWYEYKLTVIDRFGNPDAMLPAEVVNNTCGSPFAAIAAGERAERAKTAAIAARVDLNMRFP